MQEVTTGMREIEREREINLEIIIIIIIIIIITTAIIGFTLRHQSMRHIGLSY